MEVLLGGLAFFTIAVAQAVAAIVLGRRDGAEPPPRGQRGHGGRLRQAAVLAGICLSTAVSSGAAASEIARQRVTIPGTGYEVTLGAVEHDPRGVALTPSLLTAMETWLSKQFDLPASNVRPNIERVTSRRIVSLRYRDLVPSVASELAARGGAQAMRDTVAIYVDSERTIYLSNEWVGSEIAYLSILVHELVHHMQNMAGLKFECPQARERLAYIAQERWLELFGRSLEQDFELDGSCPRQDACTKRAGHNGPATLQRAARGNPGSLR